jgi:DNA topoisomerase-2
MSDENLNPFEHAFLRPDAYIGSIITVPNVETYILDVNGKILIKNISYNKGLFNIIKEIGSNCIDNRWRSKLANILMTYIKVNYNTETQTLSFKNDGDSIPIKKQTYRFKNFRKNTITEEICYPAVMRFGEMSCGTNFKDDEDRKTSGRNGMGAKVTVVFSSKFTVDHTDIVNKKRLVLTYSNNGTIQNEPVVTQFKGKNSYTDVIFRPDFNKFNYNIEDKNIETEFIGILGIYVLEIAAVTSLPVHFSITSQNENYQKKIYSFKTFDKYVRMFYPDTKEHKMAEITLKNGDTCVIVESHIDLNTDLPSSLETTRHVAFVNGVKTKSGGVHVNCWRDVIFSTFVRMFNARPKKGKTIFKTSAKEVYPYITLFIKTEVIRPSFDEQYKDYLNGPPYQLYPSGKSKSDKDEQIRIKEEIENVVTKMLKWNFIVLLENKLAGGNIKPKKIKGRKNFGPKLKEANWAASGEHPEKCMLFITEGLSAKTLVLSGISNVQDGNDSIGAFAIQGKFINAINATLEQLKKNEEAKMLMEVLNLQIGVKYNILENFKTLRYQHKVVITTDCDEDGIHIRGLLINFFYRYWPELFDLDFIVSFSTGVVRVKLQNNLDPLLFYSRIEYKKWYNTYGGENGKILEVKDLKGLGSINEADIPQYFMNPRYVNYFMEGDEKEYMLLGFDKKQPMCNLRKKWITRDMIPANKLSLISKEISLSEEENSEGTGSCDFIYQGNLGVSTFIDRQLIIYHRSVLRRALPNLIDGLKEGQRKILYAIRKKIIKILTIWKE